MDERIHLYIDGELNGAEKRTFEKNLKEDHQLYDDYAKMVQLLTIAKECFPNAEPPADLTDEIMSQISPHRVSIHSFIKPLLKIAAIIIIALITGTGIYTYTHRTSGLIPVTFRISLPQAKDVYLLGTFNKWGERTEQLKRTDSGLFVITLKLKPGIYQYVYRIDKGVILSDPNAKLYADDGFGQRNAVIIVKNIRRS